MKRDPQSLSVLHSRPPLERMLRIHQALKNNSFPNASKLAREIEVASKTIHRDIEFMRDRLGLPVEYEAAHNGYFYNGEVTSFPTMQISEGELFALVVAEKALQQYRGTSFEKPLLSAIRKMEQALPDTISLNLSEVQETISFRTRAEPVLNLEIFDVLARAVAQRQQLDISYRKPGQQKTEQRLIDPYHLANINGEWFLFAFDQARKDIRTFAPVRIRSAKITGKHFVRSQKFSLENRLRDSFGVHSGEGKYDVVIRFNERSADYVREKKWHGSQKLIERKNGEVELRLQLSSLMEIQRWVLSWGGDAKVIKPPELIESVQQAARNILGR
jgi:proteasome accessory factor B